MSESELSPSAEDPDVFSESAIEEAYILALRASEEAGMVPPQVELEPADWEQVEHATPQDSEPPAPVAEVPDEDVLTFKRPRHTPEQIIEALLFVGGEKLTARKLAGFIGHQCQDETIREYVETINQKYRDQLRPYEIILGEEGYQMTLNAEYQRQRNSVFGLGPREVRLSQDVLEVLSFVAFQQPVTKSDLEQLDRSGTMSSLRQLIRRELVETSRREDGDVEYRTTDRFLTLFGLSSLQDLPRTRDLKLK
ncbi:SMC-Scp complex subunit ScpB [Rubinisphaera margarita]|uniref:SMC-Scp complex subunit ScpB n=1 Tax=Rubinisphaera margarita TaxID=2909586 RepID=UPI001EE8B057|nr:SMC-Scp complex subunit ScpB [Rubinisphaera margarita]MCG6156934.1 SMC-Scp complex subunit ScpB [Rubinisphaera margarita]